MTIKSNSVLAAYFNRFGATGKDAVDPPPPPIQASGGTKITDGAYTYHVFLSPGSNFTVSESTGEVEYVVVAGGGGGGAGTTPGRFCAGGGAGGFLSNSSSVPAPLRGSAYPVDPTTNVSVTVGSGGGGGSAADGSNGGNSTFGSPITAIGGGGGGGTVEDAPSADGGDGIVIIRYAV